MTYYLRLVCWETDCCVALLDELKAPILDLDREACTGFYNDSPDQCFRFAEYVFGSLNWQWIDGEFIAKLETNSQLDAIKLKLARDPTLARGGFWAPSKNEEYFEY